MTTLLAETIDRLLAGEDVGRDGAAAALELVLSGQADPAQTAGLLIALRAKGESASELAGLVSAIRSHALRVEVADGAVDTCGTGGGVLTFNVSTAAAFVTAGTGIPVAKHGNRSSTSASGSADVLEALGARIDLGPQAIAECLAETGVGFMFAPIHHPAFAHVVPVRRALGVRTVFNMIGPLANPAGVRRQVVGVADRASLERVAHALVELGAERALVVRGRDGMDELSIAAVSDAIEVEAGSARHIEIDPAALDIEPPGNGALAGGDPAHNAGVIRGVLAGEAGPAAEVVALNAAAAIWVSGRADTIADALELARQSIGSGAARDRLERFVAATNRLAPAG
jgi:anthranilate phosphoribosyltransferase